MSAADVLMEQLGRYPKVSLAVKPTPLEPLSRLGRALGGLRLWVKRDDLTGLGGGGNKVRKLEYLLGEALARGADTLITTGAWQSNHARQTAAAAARLGLACHLLLSPSRPDAGIEYTRGGNLLLDRLLGARLHALEPGEEPTAAMERLAAKLASQGAKPYVIPRGGTCLLGDLGYAECAVELLAQARAQGVHLDRVVLASGSGGSHAGLVAGFHVMGAAVRVTGIAVRASASEQRPLVTRLAAQAAGALGSESAPPDEAVEVTDAYLGAGYGEPTQPMKEALALAAGTEGLLLDPVYTGKAMAGLVDLARKGGIGRDETVAFLHTGGLPGLFAYADVFA
ncbi:D-cysteine desulfhydrase family protein [Pelomicrobium sp. G1]|uniref:D-cysteine desulfhydrase family protein n=1 Tax=unclassified Pelomicrobium TaxID=2815318 RepID=UPI003F76A147